MAPRVTLEVEETVRLALEESATLEEAHARAVRELPHLPLHTIDAVFEALLGGDIIGGTPEPGSLREKFFHQMFPEQPKVNDSRR